MADGNLLGGGVVVALAAALWLVYLIPTWLRRREYMATERNAVRLQQTLRILAEAAEVPEEIRVEANARDVAETQKALRKIQQRAIADSKERAAQAARLEAQVVAEKKAAADAELRAEEQAAAQARAWAAAEARARLAATRERIEAAERKARAAGAVLPANVARGIRRGRMLASSALLLGVVAVVAGLVSSAFAAVGVVVFALIAVGVVLVAGSLAVLGRLAKRVADARRSVRTAARGAVPAGALYDHAAYEPAQVEAVEEEIEVHVAAPWTPQPLPRPLHLSRGTAAASSMASVSAAAELRRALARAELDARAEKLAAEREPAVAQLVQVPPVQAQEATATAAPVAAPAAAPVPAEQIAPRAIDSRFANMGVVGEVDAPALDLDAALRRRRAV